MRVLGIDPGSVSAAWALLDGPDGTSCGDVPVADRMVDAAGFALLVKKLNPDLAVIEEVSSMPKQGIASAFRFGFGCGILRGVVMAAKIPLVRVPPSKWKKDMHLDSDGEKSRALAIQTFPRMAALLARKKDHGRAEALLLAEWQRRREI